MTLFQPLFGYAFVKHYTRGRSQTPEMKTATDPQSVGNWKEKISEFPSAPGVYLFKDQKGTVLYVGKAKNLQKRVTSYAGRKRLDPKTKSMLEHAAHVDFIVTRSEKEALLLEASLIKRHRPKYNVILTDDKNYPAVRLDPSQPFPKVEIVRKMKKDGAFYFGPFPSAKAVRNTLKTINRVFPLRQCKTKKLHRKSRPCLNFQIGRCLGPCAGKISQEEYGKIVNEVVLFLKGKTNQLQQELKQLMKEAADELNFEKAALYRDRLRDIERTLQEQRIVSAKFADRDVIGLYEKEGRFELVLLFVRQGALLGTRNFSFQNELMTKEEAIETFITQYYSEDRFIPDVVFTSHLPDSSDLLRDWLSEKRGKKVAVRKPQKGEGRRLIELATENAKKRFELRVAQRSSYEDIKNELQKVLRISEAPSGIGCIDVSHFRGNYAVGALIVFREGVPDKTRYRKLKIRTAKPADDPAMIAEVIERLLAKDTEVADGIDLLVIDGGKAQLNSANQSLGRINQRDIPVISIAKGSSTWESDSGRKQQDKVYVPGRKNPLPLFSRPAVLLYLQQLRDEAHRFAISYQQKRYREGLKDSVLDMIPGVGIQRKKVLLQHFGSISKIAGASVEELLSLPKISRKTAEEIHNFFRNMKKSST